MPTEVPTAAEHAALDATVHRLATVVDAQVAARLDALEARVAHLEGRPPGPGQPDDDGPATAEVRDLTATGEVRVDGYGYITLGWTGPPLELSEPGTPGGLGTVSSPEVRGPLGDLVRTYRYTGRHAGVDHPFPPVTLPAPGPDPTPPGPGPGGPPPGLVAHVPFTDHTFRGLRTGDRGIRQWDNTAGSPRRYELIERHGRPWGRASILGGPHGDSIRAEGIVARLDQPGATLKLRDGDRLWFGVDLMIEAGTDDQRWNTILQWKNDGEGSPPLAVGIEDGAVQLDYHDEDGDHVGASVLGAVDVDVPHRYLFRIAFGGPGVGTVEAWRDGTLVLPEHRPPGGTLYDDVESYLKIGYYRDGAVTRTGRIYYADYRVGRTREDVA